MVLYCHDNNALQSYGGYMAAMVGSSGAGVYSTAISQAPVTDWHYYGTVSYTHLTLPTNREV